MGRHADEVPSMETVGTAIADLKQQKRDAWRKDAELQDCPFEENVIEKLRANVEHKRRRRTEAYGASERNEVDDEKQPYPDTDALYGLILAQKIDALHSEAAYSTVAEVATSDEESVEPTGLADLQRRSWNKSLQTGRKDVCQCVWILR